MITADSKFFSLHLHSEGLIFSICNSVVVELDPEAKPMKNMRLKCLKPTRTRTLPLQSPDSGSQFVFLGANALHSMK